MIKRSKNYWKSGKSIIPGILSILVILLVVAAAAFGGYRYGVSIGDEWQQRYVEFEREARVGMAFADSLQAELEGWMAFSDSISEVSQQQSRELAEIRQRAANLRQENQRLFEEVTQQELPVDCDPVFVLVDRLNEEIQQNLAEIAFLYERDEMRQVEIQTLRRSLDIQTERADSLAVIVANIPEAQGQRELPGFLSGINRRTSILIGVISGLVIGGVAF